MSGQQHGPAAIYPQERLPILQEAGWPPGPVWKGEKSCPHWDSILDCPAHSQLLYWLSYPAPHSINYRWMKYIWSIGEIILWGKPINLKRNLSDWHSVHFKSHTDCTGLTHGHLTAWAMVWPPRLMSEVTKLHFLPLYAFMTWWFTFKWSVFTYYNTCKKTPLQIHFIYLIYLCKMRFIT